MRQFKEQEGFAFKPRRGAMKRRVHQVMLNILRTDFNINPPHVNFKGSVNLVYYVGNLYLEVSTQRSLHPKRIHL